MFSHAYLPRTVGKLSVAFVLAPNFTMLAFAGFIDALRLAADAGDRSRQIQCTWTVVSHNLRPIRASCGVQIVPTAELDNPRNFNYVVVIGGLLNGPPMPAQLLDYICLASEHGVPIAGVCTGVFILARLGLITRRKCCVSWFHYAEFEAEFPGVQASSDELFLVDSDLLTCAGGIGAIHLASHLVEKHCGSARSSKAMRIMLEDVSPARRPMQPRPLFFKTTSDHRVRKAMLLLERNLATPLSLAFVARHVGLSARQLERLFKAELGMTPTSFSLTLRLTYAHKLLFNHREPIADVALQCGFVSHSHFARAFRAAYGSNPKEIRSRAMRTGFHS